MMPKIDHVLICGAPWKTVKTIFSAEQVIFVPGQTPGHPRECFDIWFDASHQPVVFTEPSPLPAVAFERGSEPPLRIGLPSEQQRRGVFIQISA